MNHMREIWRRILILQKYKFPTRVETYSFTWDENIHQDGKPASEI